MNKYNRLEENTILAQLSPSSCLNGWRIAYSANHQAPPRKMNWQGEYESYIDRHFDFILIFILSSGIIYFYFHVWPYESYFSPMP